LTERKKKKYVPTVFKSATVLLFTILYLYNCNYVFRYLYWYLVIISLNFKNIFFLNTVEFSYNDLRVNRPRESDCYILMTKTYCICTWNQLSTWLGIVLYSILISRFYCKLCLGRYVSFYDSIYWLIINFVIDNVDNSIVLVVVILDDI